MIVAETKKDHGATNLYVKSAFDLKGTEMQDNQELATIGRSPLEKTHGDILPWVPSTQAIQVPSQSLSSTDFLSVQYKETEVVFLMYNAEKSIFDTTVWPQNARYGRAMYMKGPLLAYVMENTGDSH